MSNPKFPTGAYEQEILTKNHRTEKYKILFLFNFKKFLRKIPPYSP